MILDVVFAPVILLFYGCSLYLMINYNNGSVFKYVNYSQYPLDDNDYS